MDRTRPHGKVIGIDLIPAQPPKGVATFQGDFLSPEVQSLVKKFISKSFALPTQPDSPMGTEDEKQAITDQPSYIDIGRHASQSSPRSDDVGLQLVDVCCTMPALVCLHSPSNAVHRLF